MDALQTHAAISKVKAATCLSASVELDLLDAYVFNLLQGVGSCPDFLTILAKSEKALAERLYALAGCLVVARRVVVRGIKANLVKESEELDKAVSESPREVEADTDVTAVLTTLLRRLGGTTSIPASEIKDVTDGARGFQVTQDEGPAGPVFRLTVIPRSGKP